MRLCKWMPWLAWGGGEANKRIAVESTWLPSCNKANEQKQFPSGWHFRQTQKRAQDIDIYKHPLRAAARQHSNNTVPVKEAQGLWGIHEDMYQLSSLLLLSLLPYCLPPLGFHFHVFLRISLLFLGSPILLPFPSPSFSLLSFFPPPFCVWVCIKCLTNCQPHAKLGGTLSLYLSFSLVSQIGSVIIVFLLYHVGW